MNDLCKSTEAQGVGLSAENSVAKASWGQGDDAGSVGHTLICILSVSHPCNCLGKGKVPYSGMGMGSPTLQPKGGSAQWKGTLDS